MSDWTYAHQWETDSGVRLVDFEEFHDVTILHPRWDQTQSSFEIVYTKEGKYVRVSQLAPNESFSAELLDNYKSKCICEREENPTLSIDWRSESWKTLMIFTETVTSQTRPFQRSPNPPAATWLPTLCNSGSTKHRGWRPDSRESRNKAFNMSGLLNGKESRSRSCFVGQFNIH